METYFGKPEENNLSDDINEALAAELLKGKTYNWEKSRVNAKKIK